MASALEDTTSIQPTRSPRTRPPKEIEPKEMKRKEMKPKEEEKVRNKTCKEKKPEHVPKPLPAGWYHSRDIVAQKPGQDPRKVVKAKARVFVMAGDAKLMYGDSEGHESDQAQDIVSSDRIVAILAHDSINLDPSPPPDHHLWVTSCFNAIRKHKGVPLPFYTHVKDSRVYFEFAGMYEISEATLVEARSPELFKEMRQRQEVVQNHTAKAWLNKVSLDWLRVTLKRFKEEDQQSDPMLMMREVGSLRDSSVS